MKFKKSTRANKKYMVEVNGKWVHFGDSRYQQYKDKTGVGAFSDLDHNDKERRRLYKLRHGTNPVKYSPGWFSLKYLW